MKEQLVCFQVAKLAKEKGFNEKSIYGYTKYEELMTIDRSEASYFAGASIDYKNSELESYNKPYLECNDDTYVCIYTAPAQSLLAKWLREEHRIDIIVKPWSGNSVNTKTYAADVCVFGTPKYLKLQKTDVYEHALEIGLQEALKLI